jgi:hypothetical protein
MSQLVNDHGEGDINYDCWNKHVSLNLVVVLGIESGRAVKRRSAAGIRSVREQGLAA